MPTTRGILFKVLALFLFSIMAWRSLASAKSSLSSLLLFSFGVSFRSSSLRPCFLSGICVKPVGTLHPKWSSDMSIFVCFSNGGNPASFRLWLFVVAINLDELFVALSFCFELLSFWVSMVGLFSQESKKNSRPAFSADRMYGHRTRYIQFW